MKADKLFRICLRIALTLGNVHTRAWPSARLAGTPMMPFAEHATPGHARVAPSQQDASEHPLELHEARRHIHYGYALASYASLGGCAARAKHRPNAEIGSRDTVEARPLKRGAQQVRALPTLFFMGLCLVGFMNLLFMPLMVHAQEDLFEPDNASHDATYLVLGENQTHTLHHPTDEDWIKLFVVPGFKVRIDTLQLGDEIDTALDILQQKPNGNLTPLALNINLSGFGAELGESYTLEPLLPSFVYIRVYAGSLHPKKTPFSAFLSKAGEMLNAMSLAASAPSPSSYLISAAISGPGNTLIVSAHDLCSPGGSNAPPAAVAQLDNRPPVPFNDRLVMVFSGIAEGLHTVRVSVATGYLSEEHPSLPGQVQISTNHPYGNPREVHVYAHQPAGAAFLFYPYITVGGYVRDRWTSERMEHAQLSFVPHDLCFQRRFQVYTRTPPRTTYGIPWTTGPDGSYPNSVVLPAVNYDLRIANLDYAVLFVSNIIVNPSPGEHIDLGERFVTPIDVNQNQVADAWERRYYGQINAVPAGADSDGDGLTTYEEYVLGTDPTQFKNLLRQRLPTRNRSGELIFKWPVVAGRTYSLEATPTLLNNDWRHVYGPQEAIIGQTQMQWAITQPGVTDARFYRVGVQVPSGL